MAQMAFYNLINILSTSTFWLSSIFPVVYLVLRHPKLNCVQMVEHPSPQIYTCGNKVGRGAVFGRRRRKILCR